MENGIQTTMSLCVHFKTKLYLIYPLNAATEIMHAIYTYSLTLKVMAEGKQSFD